MDTLQNVIMLAGTFIVILVTLLIVLAIVGKLAQRLLVKVAPSQVLVKSGRVPVLEKKLPKNYRLVTGGSVLVVPIFHRIDFLPLNAFQLKLQANNVPSLEGVRVTCFAVASVKISTEENMMDNAVSRFLGKDLAHIGMFAKEALEGSLRGVVARLTVEELVKDRTKFSAEVQEQVTPDLRKLGLVLDNFLIQDISDADGYIDALGAKRTAEVKRDAAIAQAEASRDEQIRVAEATRAAKIESSEARRAGEVAEAVAMEAISNSSRQRDIVDARNKAAVMAEQSRAPLIGKQAGAEEEKKLRVLTVEAEQAETMARIGLQEQEKDLNNARYEATVLVEAQKKAEATVIEAEGRRKATVVEAEAVRDAEIIRAKAEKEAATDRAEARFIATQRDAEAARLKMEQEGLGRQQMSQAEAEGQKALSVARQKDLEAEAAGLKAKKLAEAEGLKASMLAEAEGMRARLMAEAEGIRERGLAEAEGLKQKAAAFAELGDAGKLLEMLDRAPGLIEAAGSAAREAVTPLADAMGKGVASIDEVRIIDMGGSSNAGNNAFDRFSRGIPQTVYATLEGAKALGFGPVLAELANKLNLSPEALAAMIGSNLPEGEQKAGTPAPNGHEAPLAERPSPTETK